MRGWDILIPERCALKFHFLKSDFSEPLFLILWGLGSHFLQGSGVNEDPFKRDLFSYFPIYFGFGVKGGRRVRKKYFPPPPPGFCPLFRGLEEKGALPGFKENFSLKVLLGGKWTAFFKKGLKVRDSRG